MEGEDEIRQRVRDGYAEAAGQSAGGCCGGGDTGSHALDIGYDESELDAIPEEANLGLGCGNPSAIAELEKGEVVLDLGSGAGMDAFLAAEQVGETGEVIGVDMTPEMLGRARDAASRRGVSQFVEFRRGFIEDLPVVDESVDALLSNCVINLSTEKSRVFREAYRVLVPGGRLAVSDICLSQQLPREVRQLEAGYVACVSGALLIDDYRRAIEEAGFVDVTAEKTDAAPLVDGWSQDPVLGEAFETLDDEQIEAVRERIWSIRFSARRP